MADLIIKQVKNIRIERIDSNDRYVGSSHYLINNIRFESEDIEELIKDLKDISS